MSNQYSGKCYHLRKILELSVCIAFGVLPLGRPPPSLHLHFFPAKTISLCFHLALSPYTGTPASDPSAALNYIYRFIICTC